MNYFCVSKFFRRRVIFKTYGFARFLTFLLLFQCLQIQAQTIAFPGAEGFGKFTSGGRGGDVYKVTNLNDSGPGSFREACNASGARTIVFDVSGNINLNSDIVVTNDNLTIAGQTAPGDGICIRNSSFVIQASNVMVRHLRFRLGDNGFKDGNGNIIGNDSADKDVVRILGKPGGTNDVIFDHCSMSWSIDEIVEIYGSTNAADGVSDVTFQYCIFSEALYDSHNINGPNSEGFKMSENTFDVSIYKNLFSSNWENSIRSEGGCSFEMINNVVYNMSYTTAIATANRFALTNSYFKQGDPFIMAEYLADYYTAPGYFAAETEAYVSGNLTDFAGFIELDGAFLPFEQTTPTVDSGINEDTVANAITDILTNSGATLPLRDAVDNRIINDYTTTSATIIDTQEEVGGYPTLNATSALIDTDQDGMPDTWEIANGLNIADPSDRNILNTDGYTNLELYINGFMHPFSAGSDLNVCEGEDAILTASGGSNFVWNTGATGASITVNPTTTTTYTVSGLDQNGSAATDTVTVTVNPLPTAEAGDNIAICEGSSTVLTATGGDSYAWNTGDTTASITVSPSATTTYTVTVTENGCTDTDSVLVLVNPLPDANAGPDVSITNGDSTTLTASGGGFYLWNTGETTESIIVSPSATTTYSVTVTNLGCQSEDEVIVTVNSSTVIANAGADQTICEDENATLTASGGTDYLWSTGETTATITVNPTTTTIYSVTVSAGGSSDTDDVQVTVNPLPTANAGADVTINNGDSTTLTASGGGTYLWSTGETSASIIVSPTSSTTYSVTVTQNGCSASDEVIVAVNSPTVVANAGTDQTICEGENATLTASGGTDYVWSTGETTASITVNPTVTTIYSVTVSDGGVSDSDDVQITVNPLPTANAGADVTIDNGNSTTLTASGGGTYLWSTGETLASITVSPTTTTTYSVVVTQNGCSASDDVIVTVNSDTVVANAGADQTICEGSSTTLTASGGDTYLWSTGETTASITITPDATTTYSVTVSANGNSDTDEVNVSVNPIPSVAVSDDATIVQGDYITLSANGANTYEWSNGATQPNIAVSPNATTVYSVKGYVNNCYDEKQVLVTVVEQVVATVSEDTGICAGETITLFASGGDNYLWNTGETSSTIEVSPTEDTTYSVIVSNSYDNDEALVNVSVQQCEEEVEEEIIDPEDYAMKIYADGRNPSIIYVKIQGLLNPSSLYIHNVNGTRVFSQDFGSNNGQQFIIELNTAIYNQGVYFITLKENSVRRTKRILFR